MEAGGQTPRPRCHDAQGQQGTQAHGGRDGAALGGSRGADRPKREGMCTQTGTPRGTPRSHPLQLPPEPRHSDKPTDGPTGAALPGHAHRGGQHAAGTAPTSRRASAGKATTHATRHPPTRQAHADTRRWRRGEGEDLGAMGTEAHAAARGGSPLAHPHTHGSPAPAGRHPGRTGEPKVAGEAKSG